MASSSHTVQIIERFERRLEEIEAQIKPQLDEARALRAGLERLRREAENAAGTTETRANAERREWPRRTMRHTAASRNRR